MTALADQSSLPLWGWHAWAVFILAVTILLAGGWLVVEVMTAPTREAEASELDRLDGRGRG